MLYGIKNRDCHCKPSDQGLTEPVPRPLSGLRLSYLLTHRASRLLIAGDFLHLLFRYPLQQHISYCRVLLFVILSWLYLTTQFLHGILTFHNKLH